MNLTEKVAYLKGLMDGMEIDLETKEGKLFAAIADVLEDLETGRGHIVALHLKETVPGKFREIPFLTGHVDFPAVIAKAWAMGVRRYVTEMWDVGSPDWKKDIQFANRSMSKLLDEMK